MRKSNHPLCPIPPRNRTGFTLVEVLLAISIVAMTAVALAVLSRAVEIGATYTEGNTTVMQHARVTLERIQNAVTNATANEQFPGAVLFAEDIFGYRFPDTLVVWKPSSGTPVNPNGLPRFSEIVVFCPDSSHPNRLLEITNLNDSRSVPVLADTTTWKTELNSLKTGSSSRKSILTDLLRMASTDLIPGSSNVNLRGAVRFEVELRPTAAEIASYRANTLPWQSVAWPQGWYGETTGMRQTWVRMELQLVPDVVASTSGAEVQPVPFFGSASLFYEIFK